MEASSAASLVVGSTPVDLLTNWLGDHIGGGNLKANPYTFSLNPGAFPSSGYAGFCRAIRSRDFAGRRTCLGEFEELWRRR